MQSARDRAHVPFGWSLADSHFAFDRCDEGLKPVFLRVARSAIKTGGMQSTDCYLSSTS